MNIQDFKKQIKVEEEIYFYDGKNLLKGKEALITAEKHLDEKVDYGMEFNDEYNTNPFAIQAKVDNGKEVFYNGKTIFLGKEAVDTYRKDILEKQTNYRTHQNYLNDTSFQNEFN